MNANFPYILFLLYLISWGQTFAKGEGYEIELQVNGATSGMAILANYYGHTNQIKDSAEVDQGHFSFRGETPLPKGMYLVVLPGRSQYFDIIVDEDQQFELFTDTTDFVRFMEVEGSKENSVFYTHARFLGEQNQWASRIKSQLQNGKGDSVQTEQLLSTLNQINQTVEEARTSLQDRHPDLLTSKIFKSMLPPTIPEAPEGAGEHFAFYHYRTHLLDIDFSDDRLLRSPVLSRKVSEYIDDLIPKQADSLIEAVDFILGKASAHEEVFQYFCSHLLNKYSKLANEIMDMDRVFVHIAENYYASGKADWVDEETLEAILEQARKLNGTLVGDPGANLIAPDSTATPRSLYSVKGRFTIVYFWSYQCGFCKKVSPRVAAIHKEFEDQGVGLYTLNTEGTMEGWIKKLDEYDFHGTHVYDPEGRSGYQQKYNSYQTPGIYLLDRDKIIRYKRISIDQLEEILERELNP